MTPSSKAKQAGLNSLAQVSGLTGVSTQTLNNWHERKPKLFNIVLIGCKEQLNNRKEEERAR